jgi:hypothetical protein
MALLNALQPGTYAVARVINYSAQSKHVRFHVDIYKDSSRQIKVAELEYDLEAKAEKQSLPDRGSNTLPLNPTMMVKLYSGLVTMVENGGDRML